MNKEMLCSEIYKILVAPSYGYSVQMYTSNGTGTLNPIDAKWYYVKPVGFMVQVPDDENRPEVYVWKSVEISDEMTKEVLKRLKDISNQHGFGFTVQDFGTGNLPKRFSHMALSDIEKSKPEIKESFSGSTYRSYFDLPKARLVIIHSEKIDEEIRGSRTRNIKEMFIECNGERKRLETTNVQAGKALTRHMDAGGKFDDRFSKAINMYSTDMQLLKELVLDLKLQGRTHQANKALIIIKNIKEDLKRISTPKGYRDGVEKMQNLPRVGNKYIDDYAKRIMPTCGSTELARAYARQELLMECKNIATYREVIMDNLCTDYDPVEISRSAKRVCLGCVPVRKSLDLIECNDQDNPVLRYSTSLLECIDEPIIFQVLDNIGSKPQITFQDAMFVLSVINSTLGVNIPEPREDQGRGSVLETEQDSELDIDDVQKLSDFL